MSSSIKAPAWRRVFLRELGQSANVRAASRAAGIDHTTAYHYRRKNPLFERRWEEALARGREAIAAGKVPEELAFSDERPRTIRSSKTGKTCVMEAGEGRWSEEMEERFLSHLAATANVKASAAVIGMSTAALYKRKRQWPAFEAAWAEARSYAVDRLSLHLIEAATNLLDPPEVPTPDPVAVTVDQAIRVVQLNGGGTNRSGAPKRHGWRRKERDPDEIRASILRKLDLIERHEKT